MIWLLNLFPLLGKAPTALWGVVRRNPIAAGLAVLLVVQILTARLEAGRLRHQLEAQRVLVEQQKDEMAKMRGAIQQLAAAAKTLKPGEKATGEIPRPQYIPYPVDRPGPLRVEYIREPGRIETRIETIQLPPKEIEKIIDKSPQSIIAEFTAIRDIAKGEKFRLVAAQVSPGVYQPILELGAPVTVEVRTATPIERIPQLPAERRLEGRLLAGYDSLDHWVVGARATYRFDRIWAVEAEGRYRLVTRDLHWSILSTFRAF